MNIVKPYAKIVYIGSDSLFIEELAFHNKTLGIGLLRMVEEFGRVSHRSEDKQTDVSWESFIKAIVLQHGDWSITEHCTVTVEAIVDRGITHEWVRHRLGAYTQESTRFVNYEKKMPPSFIVPEMSAMDQVWWQNAINVAENSYREMISHGITPQIARSVFPNALASKLIITYNLRMWRHFFIMRTTKESHPQMREVTIPLLKEFKNCIPLLYDDIIPESRQADNLRLPR